MSRQSFSIAYSGTDRPDDHSIDVEALVPALLAVGRLIRLANIELNENRATAAVRIVSDFEHRCFNINFDTVVNFLEHAKSILGLTGENIKSAKEILEQIGLIKPAAAGAVGGLSLYGYLRYRKGRKVESTQVTERGRDGHITLKIEGENNPITITQHIFNMLRNSSVLKSVRDTFTPIGVDGFDTIEVKSPTDPHEDIILEPEEVQEILASCNSGIAEADEIEPDVIHTTAWLTTYSPVFDPKAKAWRFKYNGKPIVADIAGTRIAESALARGGAAVDDTYEVRLEILMQKDASGRRSTPKYRILKVNKFVPGSPTTQASLFE